MSGKPQGMTKVLRETLDFIANHLDREGYAPSVQDISREFGRISTNAVVERLLRLEARGLIIRKKKIARAITLTQLGLEKTGRLSPDRIRTSFDRTRTSIPGQCPPTVTLSPEKENEP